MQKKLEEIIEKELKMPSRKDIVEDIARSILASPDLVVVEKWKIDDERSRHKEREKIMEHYIDRYTKLQACLEAAEAVAEALAEGVNCATPPRYDVFSLLDNWRKTTSPTQTTASDCIRAGHSKAPQGDR